MTDLRVLGLLIALAVGVASWGLTCAAWQFDTVKAGFIPLDDRRFDRLTLITLGTAGAHENHLRRGPATAVALADAIVLVDAGRGVAESLRAASIPPSQPGLVLITSTLPENTVGLDDLLASAWLAGRREPIALVGPPGVAALARAAEQGVQPGWEARAAALGLEGAPPRFDALESCAAWSSRIGDLVVRAAALPGGPLEACAYRFEAGGREAVVSGTGWSPDALVSFAKGANMLVHEGVKVLTPAEVQSWELDVDPEQLAREAAFHTSFAEVGALAQRAGVESLVLVRMPAPPVLSIQVTWIVDDTYDGRIIVPEDGDELSP